MGNKPSVMQDRRPEGTGWFIPGECERVFALNDHEGKNAGCSIILGRDRTNHLGTGYGAEPDTQCHAIRLTAGFGSCNPGYKGTKGKYPDIDPKTGDKVRFNPSNRIDGAIIYLSQKTDVDDNFYCHPGSNPSAVRGKSAVAIKADSIRVISRDGGIKLIANTDTFTTGGERQKSHATIDFIVNNDGKRLQPLVLGQNLQKFLFDLKDIVEELRMQFIDYCMEELKWKTVVANHTHALPGQVLVPTPEAPYTKPVSTIPQYPKNPMGRVVYDSVLQGKTLTQATKFAKSTNTNLNLLKFHLDRIEENYLSDGDVRKNRLHPNRRVFIKPKGDNFILSENVNTT